MSTENLFLLASKEKYRFPSLRGEITLEQLCDLPLQSKNNTSLDSVAIALFDEIQKNSASRSFVSSSQSATDKTAENKLEIVKHIIKTKQEEHLARSEASEREARLNTLRKLREEKQIQNLKELSLEDIDKMIAEESSK